MSGSSNLSRLILLLHCEAERLGRIKEHHPDAERIIHILRAEQFELDRPWKSLPECVRTGIELRQGRVNGETAKRIRKYALERLNEYGTFLMVADRLGYTTHVIRAALLVHWERLKDEALGSDGNCIRVDIMAAVATASDEARYVAKQLSLRNGPQQLSKELGTNGSRLVSKALYELATILEGRNGT
jgi:hypothetical protein